MCDAFEMYTGYSGIPNYLRDNPRGNQKHLLSALLPCFVLMTFCNRYRHLVGTFAVAYVMTKFTEPLRLGVTIVAAPKIANLLGRKIN